MADAGVDISVCLLTYNHGHMIEDTVSSILDQSLCDYEIIISDDCSTDDTWDRLEEIARQDSRIRLVRPAANLGMAGNANFAVSHSARRYVALLHHDDLYRHDLLAKWSDVMTVHDDVGFVFNQYALEGSDQIWSEQIAAGRVDGRHFLNQYLLPRWGCPVRGTAMVRRSAWTSVGGMCDRFGLLADIDLWMRLARDWSVGYVAEPLISVRQDRPESYPAEYKTARWSWKRQHILYEIHIDSRRGIGTSGGVVGRLKWLTFRLRLSLETAKWLSYAVIRGRPDMLIECGESVTECDLWPLRFYRTILHWGVRFLCLGTEEHGGERARGPFLK